MATKKPAVPVVPPKGTNSPGPCVRPPVKGLEQLSQTPRPPVKPDPKKPTR